ncbi:MAG: rhodanese-like domain-containing protein [Idiomarinaceae bacterium]|uniref:Rhodanese-like domain-containing protein n=1 Tax=Pseudidiomarina aquimaris TaxID=641841 RepID=A0A432XNU6_9GAMM|nr:rhodanese-like domain-containing protein [Pseudidiomarina aquimaris]MBG23635.1 rhodanese-like domain-containing protein [Idiomarinaceae bacterium]RUO50354.1 rhodanese-like domain-containing protein [Pseudidiomarina aquimaris]|tara:strand:- start:600 stop:1028 length:429 start_codon:yes stop_codon:yes gene_type:complete
MDQLLAFAADHYLMSILWVVLLIAIIVSYVSAATSKVKALSAQEATLLVNRNDGVFVDIRSVDEYRKAHIHGAINLPSERIRKNDTAALDKYKAAPIVVVCATGMTAKAAAQQLTKAGYENVALLQGGISAWQGASFPLVKK